MERLYKARAAAELLLDQVDCALLACSAQGRLEHANRAARQLLRAGGPLQLQEGVLLAPPASAAGFAAALAAAAHERRSALVPLEDGERGTLLLALPGGEAGSDTAVLLMLGREGPCSPFALELLASRHGLTRAEKRVLQELLADHPVRRIAADHGVSVSTVRTQILAVRTKIGVRSVEALMLRASQMPPVAALAGIEAAELRR